MIDCKRSQAIPSVSMFREKYWEKSSIFFLYDMKVSVFGSTVWNTARFYWYFRENKIKSSVGRYLAKIMNLSEISIEQDQRPSWQPLCEVVLVTSSSKSVFSFLVYIFEKRTPKYEFIFELKMAATIFREISFHVPCLNFLWKYYCILQFKDGRHNLLSLID